MEAAPRARTRSEAKETCMRLGTRVALCAAFAFAVSSATAAESDYPSRPIRVIVPLAAASSVDAAVRILTQKMGQNMGASFVVENVDGASGQIGANRVAKAAPDGYTLGAFNDSIMTMLPNIQKNLPWDILKDFEPVSLVATIEWGLVATPDTPYRNVAELITAAKAAPGKINYGSGGIGSPQHIAMALFDHSAGVQMLHVPYKGASQAAIGVAGGEAQVAFLGLATVTSLVQGGRLKLLAVSTPVRQPQWPDTPTVQESGLPGFTFDAWVTLMAPAKTPKVIVDRLNAEALKALQDPDVRKSLLALGLTPRGTSPEELGKATRAQLDRYAKLMREANIKAE
jgi:tripartite-type tricarboxylate transporter receptor subunit TctC